MLAGSHGPDWLLCATRGSMKALRVTTLKHVKNKNMRSEKRLGQMPSEKAATTTPGFETLGLRNLATTTVTQDRCCFETADAVSH